MTDWSVPGSISWIFSVFVIGPPCDGGRAIVSVTGICTSCESPPLCDRHLEDEARARRHRVQLPRDRATSEVPPVPFGSAATETMFVPCRPAGVVVAARARDPVEDLRHRVRGDDRSGSPGSASTAR